MKVKGTDSRAKTRKDNKNKQHNRYEICPECGARLEESDYYGYKCTKCDYDESN